MKFEISLNYRKILHFLSISGTFLTLFGLLSLFQMFTFGYIFRLNYIEINGFKPSVILYSLISFFIIKRYINISSRYKKAA